MAVQKITSAAVLAALLSLAPTCVSISSAKCAGAFPTGRLSVQDQRQSSALGAEQLQELQRSLMLMADGDDEALDAAQQDDEESDEVLLMSLGTEIHQAGKRASWLGGAGVAPSASGNLAKLQDSSEGASDDAAHVQLPQWEVLFERGLERSEAVVGSDEAASDEWAVGQDSSGTVVPRSMLDAEELLKHAVEATPAELRKEKLAERAHRLYHHAKWLAERGYARAAEWRYRLAATLATKSRRSVLASHALSRLGYYLMQWRRPAEARQVLMESQRLNKKSNNLAAYLYGVLERRAAGSDEERLSLAEALIHSAGEQPSDDLEEERQTLLEDISYWREAEEAVSKCLAHQDVAKILICVCAHGGAAVKNAIDGGGVGAPKHLAASVVEL